MLRRPWWKKYIFVKFSGSDKIGFMFKKLNKKYKNKAKGGVAPALQVVFSA
jgi:hypothetical protein